MRRKKKKEKGKNKSKYESYIAMKVRCTFLGMTLFNRFLRNDDAKLAAP